MTQACNCSRGVTLGWWTEQLHRYSILRLCQLCSLWSREQSECLNFILSYNALIIHLLEHPYQILYNPECTVCTHICIAWGKSCASCSNHLKTPGWDWQPSLNSLININLIWFPAFNGILCKWNISNDMSLVMWALFRYPSTTPHLTAVTLGCIHWTAVTWHDMIWYAKTRMKLCRISWDRSYEASTGHASS